MDVQALWINGQLYLKPLGPWPVPVAGGERYPAAWVPRPDPGAPGVLCITVQAPPPGPSDAGAKEG